MIDESKRAWQEYVQCRDDALKLIKTGLEMIGYATSLGRPYSRNMAVFWRERGDNSIHNVHFHPYEHVRNVIVPRLHIDRLCNHVSSRIKRELGFLSKDHSFCINGNSDHVSEITLAVQELTTMAVWIPSLIAFRDGKANYTNPPITVYGKIGPSFWAEKVPVGSYAWTIEADKAYARIHGSRLIQDQIKTITDHVMVNHDPE